MFVSLIDETINSSKRDAATVTAHALRSKTRYAYLLVQSVYVNISWSHELCFLSYWNDNNEVHVKGHDSNGKTDVLLVTSVLILINIRLILLTDLNTMYINAVLQKIFSLYDLQNTCSIRQLK